MFVPKFWAGPIALLCIHVLSFVTCSKEATTASPLSSCFDREDFVVTEAVSVLMPDKEDVYGTVLFSQKHGEGPVRVTGTIFGLNPGPHGLHVHESGNIANGCDGAGSHFNPDKNNHGSPIDEKRHVGDLGNIVANQNGVAQFDFFDKIISLNDEHTSVIGRSVVVHESVDDLGKGNATDSKTTGHAGGRLACGVIGVAHQELNRTALFDHETHNNV